MKRRRTLELPATRTLALGAVLAGLACGTPAPSPGSGSGSGSGGGGSTGGAGSGGSTAAGGTSGASSGGVAGSSGTGGGGAGGGGSGGSTGGSGGFSAGGGGAGGSSGSGGSGGASGASGFEPCPATGPCKILPLGDSITDGFGTPGGYRIPLFALAVSAEKEITFVGGESNGPTMVADQPFPQDHEGHTGWTIDQIDEDLVPAPALDYDPHIILLHIGTNDMNLEPAGASDRLETLIDQLIAGAPDALLVVAKIIPFPGNQYIGDFNAAIPGIVEERASAGKHVILVDQFTDFPEDGFADVVHPNPTGYSHMADVWYEAIAPYLP